MLWSPQRGGYGLGCAPKTPLDIVSGRWGSVSGGGRFGEWAGVEDTRDSRERWAAGSLPRAPAMNDGSCAETVFPSDCVNDGAGSLYFYM